MLQDYSTVTMIWTWSAVMGWTVRGLGWEQGLPNKVEGRGVPPCQSAATN